MTDPAPAPDLHFVTVAGKTPTPCLCVRGTDHNPDATGVPVGQEPPEPATPDGWKAKARALLPTRTNTAPCAAPGCGHPAAEHSTFGCLAPGCTRPQGGACRAWTAPPPRPEPMHLPTVHGPDGAPVGTGAVLDATDYEPNLTWNPTGTRCDGWLTATNDNTKVIEPGDRYLHPNGMLYVTAVTATGTRNRWAVAGVNATPAPDDTDP